MKKLILVCFAALVSIASIFANPTDLVSEKVLKIFHESFPEVTQPVWHDFDNYYEVYFTGADNTSCRIDYAPDGTVLRTTRYYIAKDLSPAIRAKIFEKYPGKNIFGVTEVSSPEKIIYHIVLEDNKNWYNIESTATGNLALEKKFGKAE